MTKKNDDDYVFEFNATFYSDDGEDNVYMGCGYGCAGLMILSCLLLLILAGG